MAAAQPFCSAPLVRVTKWSGGARLISLEHAESQLFRGFASGAQVTYNNHCNFGPDVSPQLMQQCYVVDAANAPWKRSATEGITFACQVLLSGEDGGPEALRFRFDDCPSVYAHMHLTSQFQLLLSGAMDFPRGVKHLEALAIHYTDHNMPYGPFAVSGGHDMLVLHPKAGGIISMANLDARRQINLRGRIFASLAADVGMAAAARRRALGVQVPDAARFRPGGRGRQSARPRRARHAGGGIRTLRGGAGRFRYHGGQEIGPPGFRYVRGEQRGRTAGDRRQRRDAWRF